MPENLASIREHVEKRLQPLQENPPKDRNELVARYRSVLNVEEQRIRLCHHSGESGLKVAALRAELLDAVLENLYQQALTLCDIDSSQSPVTMIATGGYGRALLNPSSDVDVHFIHPERRAPSDDARRVIEEILYVLWDVGFKVGQAVRSIPETISQANQDVRTKSSLMEARLISGDEALFDKLVEQFRSHCIDGKETDYLATRRQDMRSRRDKFKTVFVQEPHVKNGCGALRDYHNLIWISFVHYGAADIHILNKKRVLSKGAIKEIEKAYDFLHRVRNELHYQAGRANDILTLHLQGVVATNFRYPSKNILRRVEAFMRDYYHHTRNLYRHTWKLLEHLHLAAEEESEGGVISFLARRRKKREQFGEFYSWNNRIYPQDENVFKDSPVRLMRVFQHMQQRHLKMSPQIMELIQSHYHLIDRRFRCDKKVRTIFEAILSRRGNVARVLKDMHRVGFLGRYLPEFGELDCLVQHEFFHRYTADHHTLLCIRKLDELADAADPKLAFFRGLFHSVEDPYVLYLAFILHDTGRAENVRFHSDASVTMAAKVCSRLQIRGQRRNLLLFLVDHHLTFWRTATTMPIDDPQTVQEFAAKMQDKRQLDLLLLFTYADSKGTNEEAWSDWKEMLMRQLYQATLLYWKDHHAIEISGTDLQPDVIKQLGDDYAEETTIHFQRMPTRYFMFREPRNIGRDIRLIRQFQAAREKNADSDCIPPVFRWVDHPEANYSEFVVCSADRRLLLAYIAGVLSAQSLNILSADFFFRTDGIVLDIFRVCTTNLEAVTNTSVRQAVKKLMADSCTQSSFDFTKLIAKARRKNPIDAPEAAFFPQRVLIDNDSVADATAIEIQAIDRLGLLYDCFMAIGRRDLEVTHSRIVTEKGAAIDKIYVTTPAGTKLRDAAELDALQAELEAVIALPEASNERKAS